MSIFSRIAMLFRMKTKTVLDRAEDPREVLEYAYEQQQLLLRRVKQGLVDVATSKRQLELQAEKLRKRIPRLEDQARQALSHNREDLARQTLERKHTVLAEIEALDDQLTEIAAEEQRLATAERQLAARVDQFKVRRQVMSASYTAAESQVRVHESLAGLSGELTELSIALGRAEEKTDQMRARASALDALLESGALEPLAGVEDRVDRELREIEIARSVEDELAAIKQAAPSEETEGDTS